MKDIKKYVVIFILFAWHSLYAQESTVLPGWFINPPSPSGDYFYSIGISDPDMDKASAKDQAVSRAIVVADLLSFSHVKSLLDTYYGTSYDKQNNTTSTSSRFEQIARIVYGKISNNDYAIENTFYTDYNEMIVLIKLRNSSQTCQKSEYYTDRNGSIEFYLSSNEDNETEELKQTMDYVFLTPDYFEKYDYLMSKNKFSDDQQLSYFTYYKNNSLVNNVPARKKYVYYTHKDEKSKKLDIVPDGDGIKLETCKRDSGISGMGFGDIKNFGLWHGYVNALIYAVISASNEFENIVNSYTNENSKTINYDSDNLSELLKKQVADRSIGCRMMQIVVSPAYENSGSQELSLCLGLSKIYSDDPKLLINLKSKNKLDNGFGIETDDVDLIPVKYEAFYDQFSPEILLYYPNTDRGFKPMKTIPGYVIGRIKNYSEIEGCTINNINIKILSGNILFFKTTDTDIVIQATNNRGSSTIKELNMDMVYREKNETENLLANKPEINYHLLVIGVSDYKDKNIKDLKNPVSDIHTLTELLTSSYSFPKDNTTILENPTRNEIILAFDNLSKSLTENDNLLIFYAGHGFWDSNSNNGYWLPSNAEESNKVEWIRNSTIRDYLKEIEANHVLLITDACFAGSIFDDRSAFSSASKAIDELYKYKSRNAMTSGSLTQVPDESVFFKYLIKRLQLNEEKYLPAQQLFSNFKIAIMNNSNTLPKYGNIQNVGDEGGDFIFIKN